jgi:hypothetical protein
VVNGCVVALAAFESIIICPALKLIVTGTARQVIRIKSACQAIVAEYKELATGKETGADVTDSRC